MRFGHDYGAVTRWVMEEALDAVTIEPTGRVVRTMFDIDPAMFAGVIVEERLFDEVADGPTPASTPRLWQAAAARLRELRRPGVTACLVVSLGDLGGARSLRPLTWTLDGVAVSAPHVPGPKYANVLDERFPVDAKTPFVVAVTPGPHRLEGGLRLFAPGAPPRDVEFSAECVVAPGEELALELACARDGSPVVRRPGA